MYRYRGIVSSPRSGPETGKYPRNRDSGHTTPSRLTWGSTGSRPTTTDKQPNDPPGGTATDNHTRPATPKPTENTHLTHPHSSGMPIPDTRRRECYRSISADMHVILAAWGMIRVLSIGEAGCDGGFEEGGVASRRGYGTSDNVTNCEVRVMGRVRAEEVGPEVGVA